MVFKDWIKIVLIIFTFNLRCFLYCLLPFLVVLVPYFALLSFLVLVFQCLFGHIFLIETLSFIFVLLFLRFFGHLVCLFGIVRILRIKMYSKIVGLKCVE